MRTSAKFGILLSQVGSKTLDQLSKGVDFGDVKDVVSVVGVVGAVEDILQVAIAAGGQ